jgi:Flp pilus assembly pilin Flp
MIQYALTWVLAKLPRSERGQDLVEYALLSGLIAVAILAAIISGVLTTGLNTMAVAIGECIDFDTTCP